MAAALSAFYKYILPDVPGCPDPVVKDAVLRACILFCEGTEVLREEFAVATVASQDYATMAPTGGDVVKVYDAHIDGKYLDRTRRQDFPTDADSGEPQDYYVEGANTMRLYPVPDAIYTVTVNASVKPDRDAATVDDLLFDQHREAVSYGAKAILMVMAGKPWTNPDLAELNASLFGKAIDRARMRVAQGGTGAPLRSKSHFF